VAAARHLQLAIAELRDMRMQPYLERALSVQVQMQSSAPSDGLSPREREVTALLARGMSNRAIAESLVISEGTAEVHVKRILNKLGFRSRSQVAAWAVEHRSANTDIDAN